jgi:hypothetical protein
MNQQIKIEKTDNFVTRSNESESILEKNKQNYPKSPSQRIRKRSNFLNSSHESDVRVPSHFTIYELSCWLKFWVC